MRLAYWLYQGTAHHGVARIANSMRGLHAVFHAPQGDDYVNNIFTMLERAPALPRMTTSPVSGRDLAMGSIRLPETLREVDAAYQPALILISASCSTTLLQENLEIIAEQADIHADTLVFDANPYRMQEIDAAEKLFACLVERYASAQSLTERPSVNILGPASLGFHVRQDLIALRRLLQTLGVDVNVVAPLGASLDDVRRLPAAWVNIAPYRELGLEAARYLETQFGTPALTDAPIGVQPTLTWLNALLDVLNGVGAQRGVEPLNLPPLTAFSLDGMSAPSGVPWFARTADMETFSTKRAFVFGDATHVVGVTRFLKRELGMQIVGVGTYLPQQAAWIREQLGDDLPGELLVTEQFQDVARQIEALQPDLICGTQMERHTGRKFDWPCVVISPPTHIENHLLSYTPILGFAGADYLADQVYTSTKLGLEKHLIDMFGDAGLDYEDPQAAEASATSAENVQADEEPRWSAEAEKLLHKIPFFVRGRVRKNTERYADEQGYQAITAAVLQEAREALGG